jgi:hypothetical protein
MFKMLTKVSSVCDLALRKIWDFAMWSPSTGRRQSGKIPANRRPGPAGRGRGSTLGSLGVDSWARLGRGRASEVGAPVARGGGRRDRCAGEVAVLWGRRAHRQARAGAREGGGGFVWTCGRPEPELAAVASNGAGGGSGRGWRAGCCGTEGAAWSG